LLENLLALQGTTKFKRKKSKVSRPFELFFSGGLGRSLGP